MHNVVSFFSILHRRACDKVQGKTFYSPAKKPKKSFWCSSDLNFLGNIFFAYQQQQDEEARTSGEEERTAKLRNMKNRFKVERFMLLGKSRAREICENFLKSKSRGIFIARNFFAAEIRTGKNVEGNLQRERGVWKLSAINDPQIFLSNDPHERKKQKLFETQKAH